MKQLAFVYLALWLFTGQSSAEWMEWTAASGGNGHFYEAVLVPGGIDWFSAKSQAEAQGGYLATITSAGENDFVFSLIASDSRFWITVGDTRGPWLGGYQPAGSPEPGGGWTWVTGEPFLYQNWDALEPNNNGDENCLHYFGEGADNFADNWNDINSNDPNGEPRGYMVESSVPEPCTSALFGLSAMLLALLRRRKDAHFSMPVHLLTALDRPKYTPYGT